MSTPDYTARVLALLAKAESTDFPAEAEALMAKAQELISRHAIDEAMLAAAGGRKDDTVETRRFVIPAPYASTRSLLLSVIAEANGAKAIRTQKGAEQVMVVYGWASILDDIETLFVSLSAYGAAKAAWATVPHGQSARRFRQAFLVGFASRIGDRLIEAAAHAEADYVAETPGATTTSTALVLVDRKAEVEAKIKAERGKISHSTVGSSSNAGMRAGAAAADRADPGQARVGAASKALAR